MKTQAGASDATITVQTPRCALCGKSSTMVLGKAAYDSWRSGTLIQKAFPLMSRDEREVLISGTHSACWDKMFGEG